VWWPLGGTGGGRGDAVGRPGELVGDELGAEVLLVVELETPNGLDPP
jgi:hypothetical protein